MAAAAQVTLAAALFLLAVSAAHAATDPGDLAVLKQLRKNLENAELLQWPANGDDPCGPPQWPHVYCSNGRVTQIQVQGLGLKGPLPENFNQLSKLFNIGLQRNQFTGKLPSFSGLSELKYAYLDYNNFDTIPSDFFDGLVNLEVMALDYNPLNATAGWELPAALQGSAQLTNLTLMNCNLAGELPEFLGNMSSLQVLRLSRNRLSGSIPQSFKDSVLTQLWLNDQSVGMTGSIEIVSTMVSLTSLWLHGNKFTGRIPEKIGDLVSLQDLDLNGNDLVGLIPSSLASMELQRLDLNNNHFMGPVPKFSAANFTYESNPFCLPQPGVVCAPNVMALLQFLDGVNYPSRLVGSWLGNDPCKASWLGVGCDTSGKVITVNLPNSNLSGVLSPSIANLDSITHVYLQSNNLSGLIPSNWTSLKSLAVLDLSNNNLSPPVPKFSTSVHLVLGGNSLLVSGSSSKNDSSSSPDSRSSPTSFDSNPTRDSVVGKRSSKLYVIVAPLACFTVLICLVVPVMMYLCKKKKGGRPPPSSIVVHPRAPSDSDSAVKIVVADNTNRSVSSLNSATSASVNSSSQSHVIEAGNLVISVQVLRDVTKNFAPENELGRGGFGVVYKGELDDGTKIAVKRMEAGVISNKALDEFRSEIAVLSKVRHRHLVSLLGFCVEGNERILVYEYMSEGALSGHLFHWKKLHLEPLSWKRRLNIALDVARGLEYLHTLAHQSFIHRDLKPSNILLGDDFRAKVSDFGLVKLAPEGEKSVVTRLAGTFGYLAPEYAGKQGSVLRSVFFL